MRVAIITLGRSGLELGKKIQSEIDDSQILLPDTDDWDQSMEASFDINELSDKTITKVTDSDVKNLVEMSFNGFDGLVMIMALGIVVRLIAPHLKNKYEDPAVVTVDHEGQYTISTLSGHEGGANLLAIKVASAIGAQPIVTTASESMKKLSVGIGCRRDITLAQLSKALDDSLHEIESDLNDIRWFSTIDIKRDEEALNSLSEKLSIPVRYFTKKEIAELLIPYERSFAANKNIGVDGVSEPCALLGASGGGLVLKKRITDGVTIAIAEIR